MKTKTDVRNANIKRWFNLLAVSDSDPHMDNATAYANELCVSITRAESKEITWAILNLCPPTQFSVLFGHPAEAYDALVESFFARLDASLEVYK